MSKMSRGCRRVVTARKSRVCFSWPCKGKHNTEGKILYITVHLQLHNGYSTVIVKLHFNYNYSTIIVAVQLGQLQFSYGKTAE